MKEQSVNFLRYPGGKQRLLRYLIQYLPSQLSIQGRFVEPFIGGGAVFFALHPRKAILSDINEELIELYNFIGVFLATRMMFGIFFRRFLTRRMPIMKFVTVALIL